MQLGLGHEPTQAQRRAGRLPRLGGADIACHAKLALRDRIDADKLLQQLAAEDLVYPLAMRGHRRDVELRAVLGEQIERLVEIGEAIVRHRAQRVGQLGALGPQELAPGRHVEEQVLHRDARAGRASIVAHVAQRSAADLDDSPRVAVRGAGRERDAGDAGNRGQGLAAKAESGDGEQILGGAQLAGRVPLEREQGIVAVHAAAVVADLDQAAAAAAQLDSDLGSPCVKGVLDQFLADRSRPLDHFAGGDLVRDLVCQYADAAHDPLTSA